MSDECLMTLETVFSFYIVYQAVMRKFTLAGKADHGHLFVKFSLRERFKEIASCIFKYVWLYMVSSQLLRMWQRVTSQRSDLFAVYA